MRLLDPFLKRKLLPLEFIKERTEVPDLGEVEKEIPVNENGLIEKAWLIVHGDGDSISDFEISLYKSDEEKTQILYNSRIESESFVFNLKIDLSEVLKDLGVNGVWKLVIKDVWEEDQNFITGAYLFLIFR